MGDAQWERVKSIVDHALDRDPSQRDRFLLEACGGDETLLREAASLLGYDDVDSLLETAATAVPASPELRNWTGRRLGNYEVEDELSRGGMGVVYRAKDVRLGRKVAIKVLPEELASNAERLGRFEREARTASALNHPNIITIYAVDEHDGAPYIAMELVDGDTLREKLTAPLPIDQLLRCATQVVAGLGRAHAAGIVHRDLKPENIMIRRDGLVKILDFGLAKPTVSGHGAGAGGVNALQATAAGTILGTAPYMSPEQASALPLDFRSDQFSFGSILYEMGTGERAFRRRTVPQTLSAILEDEPPPMRRLRASLPAALGAVVERCLSKNPDERYGSTEDLAYALERVPTEESMSSVSAASELGEAPPIESIAVLPFKNLSGDAGQEYLADGITESLIIDLAKLGALRVISRTSVMSYKASEKPLPKIARELGIAAVVEGSVVRMGDRIRVTAQLIHAEMDRLLWAESYDRDFQDLLVVQGELTRAIAGEVQVKLTREQSQRLADARTVDPEAHEAYLRGRFHAFQFTPPDLEKAIEYYETSLAKDPEYALAYVGIAQVWSSRLVLGLVPPLSSGPKMLEAASRAVEIDDTLAEAHGMMAQAITWHHWDWKRAEAAFERAIELNPSHGDTHLFYGHFLGAMRRFDEAREHLDRALALDPLNSFFQGLYGVYLCWVADYDEAIERCRQALQTSPHFPLPRLGLWIAHAGKHEYKEALAEVNGLFAGLGDVQLEQALSQGADEGGYAKAMERAAETLVARAAVMFVRPFMVAHFFSEAGKTDEMFEWLEKAFEARDHDIVYLSANRWTTFPESTSKDDRFVDLLRRLNLPE